MQTISPEAAAIHRRYMRLVDARERRLQACRKALRQHQTPSPERAKALADFHGWMARVSKPLDARLWPLMQKAGLGAGI